MLMGFILYTSLVFGQTTPVTEDVKKLFSILLPSANHIKQGLFTLKECPDYQMDWLQLALLKKSFSANYIFIPQCDIEGSFSPQMEKVFTVPLKLRNIGEFNKTTMNTILKITPADGKLRLDVVVTESVVESLKDKVTFSGQYAIAVEPLQFDDFENLGGEIRIHEINGKKVDIREKITIK